MSYKLRFTLTGEMPLLMHADNVEEADTLTQWRKDPANKNVSVSGDDRSPPWTWQAYLYHDGENVAIPSANLAVCIRQAAAQIILKKQKTFKELSQSGMMATAEFLDLRVGGQPIAMADVLALREQSFAEQSEAARKMGFRLDVRRARVGQSKHVRVRPRFDTWTADGVLEVIAPELKIEIVDQMFQIAGRVGLGDWRPGCKTPGPFGMFSAKLKKA